jgi:hypothetical protein
MRNILPIRGPSFLTKDLVVVLFRNNEFPFLHCHWFHPSFCWSPYITSLHTNLYTAPTNQNAVRNKFINPHTQNTTTFSQMYLNYDRLHHLVFKKNLLIWNCTRCSLSRPKSFSWDGHSSFVSLVTTNFCFPHSLSETHNTMCWNTYWYLKQSECQFIPGPIYGGTVFNITSSLVMGQLTFMLLMWRIGWAPNSIPIYIQQGATLHSLFISRNCPTWFGWHLHPSSGAHTTVSTASGICHTVTAICRYHGRVGTGLSVLCGVRHPQHTHTVSNSSTIAADSCNGVTNTRYCRYSCMRSWWKYHQKHVEQFPDINKLFNVASFWIYLRCTCT